MNEKDSIAFLNMLVKLDQHHLDKDGLTFRAGKVRVRVERRHHDSVYFKASGRADDGQILGIHFLVTGDHLEILSRYLSLEMNNWKNEALELRKKVAELEGSVAEYRNMYKLSIDVMHEMSQLLPKQKTNE